MLALTSVAGNIFADKSFAAKYRRAKKTGKCERLLLSRMEMEKLRLRRSTDRGTDVGIIMEPGSKLHHGDVLASGKFIVIEQLPEKVASISMKKSDASMAALIGHAIGNRHRPIAVDHGTISFPIQAESEVDTFRKLLPAGVKLKIAEQVFLSSGQVHSHE